MKNIYRWLSPALIGILTLVIVWFMTGMPQIPEQRWGGLFMVIILSYLAYIIFHAIVLPFFLRKRIKTGIEYVIVLFFIALTLASASIFATIFINHQNFSWTGLIGICVLGTPIMFVQYLAIRNSKITEEYNRQTLQLEKTRNNQLETELKYLRAQYHPHFLFNALNTVYFQIDDPKADAKNTVELLSELLRYQLYNMEKEVEIIEEINFIKSYIRFQQLRMTKRLVMNVSIDKALNSQKIYPLIYQPFLENAFKYVGGEYWINIEMKLDDNQIIFHIENSLPEQMQQTKKSDSGIGIENIKRRLALLYPNRHQLNIEKEEKSFEVGLTINF